MARRRPKTRSCTPPSIDCVASKGTSYGIRHDHRIRQGGALVAQPQQAEPGTGRRRDRHCVAHRFCARASWLCDDEKYPRPRPQHLDSRHPRSRHGADRHQPQHRPERNCADGLPVGRGAHRQSTWTSAVLDRRPRARHRRHRRLHQRLHGRICRGAGAVRHPGHDARCLRRVVLDLAGLRRLCAEGCGCAFFRGARFAVRHTDADHRVCGCGAGHALLPVADLDRPLHLCTGRQSRSRAGFRASRCGR